MAIKKSYTDIVNFLKDNENKKVSSILDEVLLMCESKKQASTYIADENGDVVAIFCYYHKQWEILKDVPYGKKVNSTTGFNTMCKVGVSKWTKKQRDAKTATANILTLLTEEKVKPSHIKDLQNDIEHERTLMDQEDMPIGYVSEEELMVALKK